jgi:hypothetical protein
MVALEEGEGGYEETTCCEGEEDDGAPVGGLGFWRSRGGVVEALGAALGVGRGGTEAQRGEDDDCGEKASGDCGLFACGRPRYLLKSRFLHCAALRVEMTIAFVGQIFDAKTKNKYKYRGSSPFDSAQGQNDNN